MTDRSMPVDRPAVGLAVRGIAGMAVAGATILTIAGVVALAFFNPVWVDVAQARAGVDRITGYPASEVRRVTNQMIREIYLGPGTFEAIVGGQPVLTPRERGHMGNVRDLVLRFFAITALGTFLLFAAGLVSRGAAWFWRGVAAGSGALVVVGVVVGGAFLVAFDAAFEVFHLLLFPPGSFVFDPRVERLVQLFPEQLWVETSIAIAVSGLALALAMFALARWRLAATRHRP